MSEDKTKIDEMKDYDMSKDAGMCGIQVDLSSCNEPSKRGYRAGKMIRDQVAKEIKKEIIEFQERSIDKREKIIIKQEEVIDKYKSIIYCLCLLFMALAGGVCYFAEVF